MAKSDIYKLLFVFVFILNLCHARKPEIIPLLRGYNVEQNESYQLMCSISKGTKPIQFQWLKNGHKLSPNSEFSFDFKPSSSIISFESFLPKHSGNYSCRASNSDGFDQTSTVLQIKGLSFWSFFLRFSCVSNAFRDVALQLLNMTRLKV